MVHMPLVNIKWTQFIVLLLISWLFALVVTRGNESWLPGVFFAIFFILGIIWNVFQWMLYLMKKTDDNWRWINNAYRENEFDFHKPQIDSIGISVKIWDSIEHTLFWEWIIKYIDSNTVVIEFLNWIERTFLNSKKLPIKKIESIIVNPAWYKIAKNPESEWQKILNEIIEQEMPWLKEVYSIGDRVEYYDFSQYDGTPNSVVVKICKVVEVINHQNIIIEFPDGTKKHENLVLSVWTIKKITY